MSLIKDQIIRASAIDLTNDELVELQSKNILDDEFAFLVYLSEVISKMTFSFKNSHSDWAEILDSAGKNIKVQQDRILKFYEQFFPEKRFIGQFGDDQVPDVIVVLGANPPVREIRAHYAGELAKKYSKAVVVVSGGGFSVEKTEAEFMQKVLLLEGISPDRVLLEEDAMDTIGNAIFSKLLLKKFNLLREGLKILIVTSKFHASRSLSYFMRIFSNEYKVSVSAIKTLDEKGRLAYSSHELLSEYQSIKSIFSFERRESFFKNGKMLYNDMFLDDQTLLFQLFTKHELYKERYDLLRKFFLVSGI